MKTFKDLKFKPHSLSRFGENLQHARLSFPNGFGVSVLFGDLFYSDTTSNTYELAMLHNDHVCYSDITKGNTLGYLTKKEVSEVMRKIQKLPEDYTTESLPYYE